MFEIGSPHSNTARNFLMSNVEIVHPQQPQDISSLKDSENEFEKQFKVQSLKKLSFRKKVRTKSTFFQLIKTQQKVIQFVQKMRKNANLLTQFPKSVSFDYLMRTIYKGNYAAKQYSFIILFKLQLKCFWEIFLYIINLSLIFLLPFNIVYQNQLLLITLICFIIEMGIKFFKPFYQEGRLIRDNFLIIKNYLNLGFIFDVLKIAAILFQILNIEDEIFEIVSYVIVFLFCIQKLHLKFLSDSYFYVKFLELFCLIILTCHFFSNQLFSENKNLDYLEKFSQVLDFFFQQKSNFLPQNNNFILTHIFFELISAVFKAYILVNLVNFCLLNQEQFRKKRELFNLHKHLKALKVSSLIANRVISYYKTIMKQDQQIKIQDFHTFFTQKLKPNLAQELKLQIQGNFLENFKVFNKFTVQTLKKLIYNMEDVDFTPNQVIYQQNVPDDQGIYFIVSGKVLITFANSELKTLDEKSSFGQVSFFTGEPRNYSATSLGYTKLYKISRQVFISAVSQVSQDLETAQMIKDQILFQQRYDVIGRRCYCCQEFNHLIQICPKLHYQPNKDVLLSRLLFPVKMQRKKFNRIRKRYPNTLHNQFINHMAAQEFQENNNLLNEDDESEHLLDVQLSSTESLLDEFKMKSSYSPDPFSVKVAQQRKESEDKRSRQPIFHTIQEYSDEIQSASSCEVMGMPAVELKEEPQIRIIQQQIKPKGDLLKSQNSGGRPIQCYSPKRQSQNVLDLSLIPPNTKKTTLRSCSQLSLEEKTLQRQKSKRTNTSQQNIQSLMQLFQIDNNPIMVDFIQIDMDRGFNFRTYLPNNNMQVVLKQMKQTSRLTRSAYTLNYELSKKLRKILSIWSL